MKKNLFLLGITAALLTVLCGCKTITITIEQPEPPRVVKDLNSVNIIEVTANTRLSGTAVSRNTDTTYAIGILCKSIASELCREGFYRQSNFEWDEMRGADSVAQIVKRQAVRHGYVRVFNAPEKKAKLQLSLSAVINNSSEEVYAVTKTFDRIYETKYYTKTIYWGPSDRQQSQKVYVPYSSLVSTVPSTVRTSYTQHSIAASGTLTAELLDKNGQEVYKKTFDLSFSAVNDPKKRIAMPTNAEIIAQMTLPAAKALAKDISPFRQRLTLVINKDGSRQGRILLETLAFSEAVRHYESIPEKDRTFADWENLGLAYEAVGEYAAAYSIYQRALEVKNAQKGLFDYDKNIAELGLERTEKSRDSVEKLKTFQKKNSMTGYKKEETR